jgi:hypothetical protein
MAREVVTGWQVESAYSVQGIYDSLSVRVGAHSVSLDDDLPASTSPSDRAPTRVRILVDGRDYGAPAQAEARPHFRDSNRYHGYVSLKRLTDRRSGLTTIVVAQALGATPGTVGYDENHHRYRVLTVSADGLVKEDVFTYAERGAPAVRARQIDGVVPHPFGYHSDLMQVWPSFWYPVLYPWLSGSVGAAMLALSLFIRRRRSHAEVGSN